MLEVDQNQVGLVAFPYETAVFDLKTNGRRVAHLLYHFFKTEFACFNIVQHQQHRMLYQGQAGMGMEIVFLFFGPGMRRMVSSNDIEPIIE